MKKIKGQQEMVGFVLIVEVAREGRLSAQNPKGILDWQTSESEFRSLQFELTCSAGGYYEK